MKYDYIIVGQGLAGGLLSYLLLGSGKRLLVIDKDAEHNASHVAAGLINPITGPKMVKTWKADTLFPFLDRFYSNMEASLKTKFYYRKEMYRPFSTVAEQNDWQAKWREPHYQPFVRKVCSEREFGGQVKDPLGGLLIKQSGHIEMNMMLDALATFIKRRATVLQDNFEESDLELKESSVNYGPYTADKIIFCTGYHQSSMKRFFGWLPVGALKGEILEIKTHRPIQTLYNRGCFIIPMTGGRSMAGSTYQRHDLSTTITEKGREEIRTRLSSLLNENEEFIIIGQKAGIRPVSPDRRPMLGLHPECKQIGIFNGLGTKGVTLAPYYANQLVNFLINGDDLDVDVNIKRFYSLYYEPFIVR